MANILLVDDNEAEPLLSKTAVAKALDTREEDLWGRRDCP